MMKKTMIATLLMAGLVGCKSTTPEQMVRKQCDENRAAIEKTIKEPQRQAAMLALIDSFEADIREIAADSADARNCYDAALRQYDSTPTQLKALQAEMVSCLDRLCGSAEKHSLELRSLCSEEEWGKLVAHYHKLKNVVFL